MDRETFREIGFDEQEITIYIYILKNGACSQQEISDDTQILRQTVYDVMKKMMVKGYISLSIEGKKKLYSAVSPKIILHRLKNKQDEFEKMIPALLSMQKEKQGVYSETFIGLVGLKNLFNLTLESKSEILWATNEKINDFVFKDFYWENYALKRIEKKIPINLLVESSKGTHYTSDKKVFRETRSSELLEGVNSSFALFDDCVIFYTTEKENLFGVFIKNRAIKDLMQKMFFQMWESGKKI